MPFYGVRFAVVIAILFSLLVVAIAFQTDYQTVAYTPSRQVDASPHPPLTDSSSTHLWLAIYFGGFVLIISSLVAAISFIVYLFSDDKSRSRKAGGVFKTSFGFLLTTGGGVMAYLGFSR